MNYYEKIKNELINNEVYKKVKDYSKNRSDLNTYYKVGKLLNDAGKSYGEGIIKKYSDKLTKEFGRKYNYRNLFIMRKFYIIFKDENVNAMRSQLSWTHYRELLTLNNINEIKKEHIGQIETYMNFIDKNLRTINQVPTIGIIVCKKKNGYLFKYVTNKNIYEREYELIQNK